MKIKTSELTGPALDWAVEEAGDKDHTYVPRNYSTEWGMGGPIIDREVIALNTPYVDTWCASSDLGEDGPGDDNVDMYGDTALIAAMRCYVAAKLGDEVDIPDELT
jgi:hypothetical protein